jgi:hypothetical protein
VLNVRNETSVAVGLYGKERRPAKASEAPTSDMGGKFALECDYESSAFCFGKGVQGTTAMRDELKVWVCDICGANVAVCVTLDKVVVPFRPELPERCALKEFRIGNECIAFWSLERARELLKKAS